MKRHRIPPEVDEMLWKVVESQDKGVAQEFERRYPQYRGELMKRQAMLDALRRARPTNVSYQAAFRVSEVRLSKGGTSRPNFSRRFWWIPLTAVFLGSVALASYWLTRGLVGSANLQPLESQTFPAPHRTTSPSSIAEEMHPVPQQLREEGTPGSAHRPFTPPSGTPQVVLRTEGLSLHKALQEISRQTQTPVAIMPEVPDVALDLRGFSEPSLPPGELSLPVDEMLLLLEKVAPIRVLDNGPEGYVILPIEKIQNALLPRLESSPKVSEKQARLP